MGFGHLPVLWLLCLSSVQHLDKSMVKFLWGLTWPNSKLLYAGITQSQCTWTIWLASKPKNKWFFSFNKKYLGVYGMIYGLWQIYLLSSVRCLKRLKFKHCTQSYHFICVSLKRISLSFQFQNLKKWSPVSRRQHCYIPLKSMTQIFKWKCLQNTIPVVLRKYFS